MKRFSAWILALLLALTGPVPPERCAVAAEPGGEVALETVIPAVQIQRQIRDARTMLNRFTENAQSVDDRLQELRLEKEKLEALISSDGSRRHGVDRSVLLACDKSLENLIRRYITYRNIYRETDDEEETWAHTPAPSPPPPYSIRYYDEQRFEYEQARSRYRDGIFLVKTRLKELNIWQKELRNEIDALNTLRETHKTPTEEWRYKMRAYEKEIDEVQLAVTLSRVEDARDYHRQMTAALADAVAHLREVRQGLLFEEVEFDRIRDRIDNTVAARTDALERGTERVESLYDELQSMAETLDRSIAIDGSTRQGRTRIYLAAATSLPAARYANLTARYRAEGFRLYCLTNEINLLLSVGRMWDNRYEILRGGASGSTFWRARNEARLALEELNSEEQYILHTQSDFQTNYTLIANQLIEREFLAEDPEVAELLEGAAHIFQQVGTEVRTTYEVTLRDYRLLCQAILEETAEQTDRTRLLQRAEKAFLDFRNAFIARVIWRGEGFEVTAYSAVRAILLILVGYFASALLSRVIAQALRQRLAKNNKAFHSIRRGIFYTLWLFFFMIALSSINVPLTAFTFLGGALALAFGFGAQDICRNLIGGAIILFNRPFTQGDIMDIDGQSGIVQEIGPRTTTILTYDGLEVIIPNSHFVANKIVNRTRTAPMTRTTFTLAVCSDSDPDAVEETLREIVKGYRNESEGKEPFITLADMSRDSLTFKIYYWLDIKQQSPLRTSSRLRKEIHRAFAEKNIRLYQPVHFKEF